MVLLKWKFELLTLRTEEAFKNPMTDFETDALTSDSDASSDADCM